MTKIKTKEGFSCEVNEDKVKDWRFVKGLADCTSKNENQVLKGVTFVVPFLLGEDGEEKLMDFLTEKEGFPKTDSIITVFKEIMEQLSEETKKSKSSQS